MHHASTVEQIDIDIMEIFILGFGFPKETCIKGQGIGCTDIHHTINIYA
jgi:hypothetical protein